MPVTDIFESTKKVEKKFPRKLGFFFSSAAAQRDAAQQRAKISSSRDAETQRAAV